jgi:pyruvate kinase
MAAKALRRTIGIIRAALPDAPIVVDLQGAKMRLGEFSERTVAIGQVLRFSADGAVGECVPLPHPELFASVKQGETLSCDDDRLRFRIVAADEHGLQAEALLSGTLRPRKGVNLVEHPVELTDLTDADRQRIDAIGDLSRLALAFSFMKDGSEAAWLRRLVPNAPVVGKIERAEAIADLRSIDSSVDAIWICRGDLGAQLGMPRLAEFVATVSPKTLRRPVLMAGQVIEHLTEHAAPTRSEVCHLFDLHSRGYAGLVLSDETAVGRRPVQAVEAVSSLIAGFRRTD